MNILLKDIDIVTSDESSMFIKCGNIGIKDGCIEFVGGPDSIPMDFKAEKIIDGKHRLVMPGLINAHTHCAMTLFRNFADDLALEEWLYDRIFPAELHLSPDDIYWGTKLGIAEMLLSGTTAFADMYIHMDSVAQAVAESGIRANISRNPVKLSKSKDNGIFDDSKACFAFYEKWNGSANGRIRVYIEVHSTYLYNEQSLRSAAELAKHCGTGIHMHMLESSKELEKSKAKYGMDSIEVCDKFGIFEVPVLAAHCVYVADKDMDVLKNYGVNVVHNPTSNMKLGSGIARVPLMLDRGIGVSLGTDGAASNNNLNMLEEMHLAALIHKGINKNPQLMGADRVVRMATANAARAIGFGGKIGCVKKGMRADLTIIDTDKLHFYPMNDPISAIVYSAQAADVDTVIVDGCILMEGRELKTIDEELVKFKAKEIAKKLCN
jgi:5-methylthioadenosine/S-adenosylhomocysteine deaminase